jgi:hypothetical protein
LKRCGFGEQWCKWGILYFLCVFFSFGKWDLVRHL